MASLLITLVACSSSSTDPPSSFEGDEPGECSDGADNDRDGAFDCDDTDCREAPACAGGSGGGSAEGGGGAGGGGAVGGGGVSGLDARPPNPTCVAPPRPPASDVVGLELAYPDITWDGPTAGAFSPTRPERLYIAEKRGTLRYADPGSPAPVPALDLSSRVQASLDMGLVSMAFSPDFASSGRLYVVYNTFCEASAACPPLDERGGFFDYISRIARFTSADGGETFPLESEEVILDLWQPVDNHTVNQLAFGPDGMLYVASGDGGCCGDPLNYGQDLTSLRGKLLRLDVAGTGPGYAVPPDNPFFGAPGVAPEIWAYGLRNPWKMSFDRGSGSLWLGDVGQDNVEEVDIVERGGNYGWNSKEGPFCFAVDPCDDPAFIDPVAWYTHEVGNSVTGGFVYRGSAIPALSGAYLFGDYVHRQVWALFRDGTHLDLAPEVGGPYAEQLLFESEDGVVSFLEDAQGELYIVSSSVYDDAPGRVFRLVPPRPIDPGSFPQTLSQTGCFREDAPTEPLPGLIPYEVNAPFWSDGADKRRWMALPDGQQATVDADGDFDFPPGTVLAKEFTLGGRRIETRLFMRHDDGRWAGYSYAWRDDGSDADLVEGQLTRDLGDVTWRYPSRAECLFCHSEAAGRSLGLEVRQLDRLVTYEATGRTANQLETLLHIGVADPTKETARYGFEETSGSVARDALGGLEAIVHGDPRWTGDGLFFDGIDDYVETRVPNAENRTLAAWIRPASSDFVPFIESVIDSDVPGQYGSGFGLNDGRLWVILDNEFWDTGVTVRLDAWQHVALSFDARTARLYVDGALTAELPYQGGQVTAANYLIGRSNANALFFHGQIRDVRIFDVALDPADVAAVYADGELSGLSRLAPLPNPYGDAPEEERARAYLHTNCSQCHRPSGPGRGAYDVRFDVRFADTGLCDATPVGSDLGIADARIVAPGEPDRSLLLHRMLEAGTSRMPPVSSRVVDEPGTALIRSWITSLRSCD